MGEAISKNLIFRSRKGINTNCIHFFEEAEDRFQVLTNKQGRKFSLVETFWSFFSFLEWGKRCCVWVGRVEEEEEEEEGELERSLTGTYV